MVRSFLTTLAIIIGTAAVTNPGFLHEACFAFPGQIIVGLDAKDGDVAINGWEKMTGHNVIELAQKFEDYGVESVIYTDIGRDGMLAGVNVDATVKLSEALKIPVIASGGVSNLNEFSRDFTVNVTLENIDISILSTDSFFLGFYEYSVDY